MGFKQLSIIAAAALLSSQAMAGLTGDTVGTRYVGAGDTGVQNAVVGAGGEGNFFNNQFYDYTDNGFSITSTNQFCGIWSCSGPIALELSSLDMTEGPITGVSFSTNLSGVSVAYTATSVTFSWSEQTFGPGMYIDATFLTGVVPEPSTYALMALGLAAVAGIARRKVRA
ncbi:MAG: PEP-CTERM sorting domain-containing protein [Aquabacterium sp.]